MTGTRYHECDSRPHQGLLRRQAYSTEQASLQDYQEYWLDCLHSTRHQYRDAWSPTQLVTVFLIIALTVLTIFRSGCDELLIGSRLKAKIRRIRRDSEKRTDTYISLRLSEAEEKSMSEWSLMPHKDNEDWWQQYNNKKQAQRLLNGPAAPQKVETATTKTQSLVNGDCALP
jgi:hypothetical protein